VEEEGILVVVAAVVVGGGEVVGEGVKLCFSFKKGLEGNCGVGWLVGGGGAHCTGIII